MIRPSRFTIQTYFVLGLDSFDHDRRSKSILPTKTFLAKDIKELITDNNGTVKDTIMKDNSNLSPTSDKTEIVTSTESPLGTFILILFSGVVQHFYSYLFQNKINISFF